MEELVSIPSGQIQTTLYTVLKESLTECVGELEGVADLEKAKYERRLKELCAAIYDAFCRRTTIKRTAYRSRMVDLFTSESLFPPEVPIDPTLIDHCAQKSRDAMDMLNSTLEESQRYTGLIVKDIIADSEWTTKSEEEKELPDLVKESEALNQVLKFERELKERTLEMLRQSQSVPRAQSQDPSLMEAQVARFLYQGF